MTQFGVKVIIDSLDARMRGLERQIEKCELREKQLIIMFKMILDKTSNPHRSKDKEVRIKDIIDYMEQLVNKNLTPEEIQTKSDLISDIIKKGY